MAISISPSVGGASLTSDQTFSGQNTFGSGTITTSKPFTISQTWNAGGVTFTGLSLSVTDTASAAASLLADFRVGGSTKLCVSKSGKIGYGTSVPTSPLHIKAFHDYPNGQLKIQTAGTDHLISFTDAIDDIVGYIQRYPGGGMRFVDSEKLVFIAGGDMSMVLDSDGSVDFSALSATAAVAIASTHKIAIKIGGTTYYLLASNA